MSVITFYNRALFAPTYLSIHPSIHLFICLSIRLFIYIYLSGISVVFIIYFLPICGFKGYCEVVCEGGRLDLGKNSPGKKLCSFSLLAACSAWSCCEDNFIMSILSCSVTRIIVLPERKQSNKFSFVFDTFRWCPNPLKSSFKVNYVLYS